MTTAFAVVGPGRMGTALACLWSRAGADFVGFVGTSDDAVARAIAFCGAGRALDIAQLGEVSTVLLTPPDDELEHVVATIAGADAIAGGSLFLHTSGVFGLDVLAPLQAAGARIGSMHPLCPVPDAASGVRDLGGKPAVLQGAPDVRDDLAELASRAGLAPVWLGEDVDRVTYHAACALAANGLTALFDIVRELFEVGCGISGEHAQAMPVALMRAALDAIERQGARDALSGPVQRGDVEVVERHLSALVAGDGDALSAYRALMARAARLSGQGGSLSPDEVERMLRRLGSDGSGSGS